MTDHIYQIVRETLIVRAAAEQDLVTLRVIERAAGQIFRGLDMGLVADDEPPTMSMLREYVTVGRAWTADSDGQPVAYLLADIVDGNVHIEQVSVHPEHSRQGIGLALIEHVARWAVEGGYPALTLTTFTDVPWNGPYYRRCGFRYLAEEEVTPGLRTLRAHETEHGLDQWPRACMRRDL